MFTLALDTRDTRLNSDPSRVAFEVNMNGLFMQNIQLQKVSFINGRSAFYPDSNTITFDVASTEYSVEIPQGDYSGSEIASYLTTEMTSVGPGTYLVTFDSTSLKLTFAVTSGTNISFVSTAYDAYYQLGITTLDGAAAASIVGDLFVRLDGPEYVYLTSDFHSGSTMFTSSGKAGIIAKIPLYVGYGGYNVYEPQNPISLQIPLDNQSGVREMNLILFDPNGVQYTLPSNCNVQYEFVMS